jgi:hypothetical protein
MRIILHLLFIPVLFFNVDLNAQECKSTISITLKNIRGGVYANQSVVLTNKADGKKYSAKSSFSGTVNIDVPCNSLFDLSVSNYTRKKEIQSPESEGGKVMKTLTYEPDMAAKDKMFAMSESEKAAMDKAAESLPDTVSVGSVMSKPKNMEFFIELSISIDDIDGNPLVGEQMNITGEKRKKKIKAVTDRNGKVFVYLPKGDNYHIDFKYHKSYISKDCEYSKGFGSAEMNFSYLGTREIEKRKKEEAARIAAEEKRLKEEAIAFEKRCREAKISMLEGMKREVKDMIKDANNSGKNIIAAVFGRNNWTEKLIVCDLTGSMSPYAAQLSAWYQMSYLKERNLQFVFFNDGDNKSDHQKKIGDTGGIYYSKSEGIDPLFNTIAMVSTRGGGGDCPENNMEALIKGTKMAKQPFKELIMIADNHAPVKDIELLKEFKTPVHIILCGVYDGVLEDYLTIAWKTKGSVHTMEEDITKLATMLEGQEIKVGGTLYRIMGGEFVTVRKT